MSITCSCMTASRTFTLTSSILGASLPRRAASPRVPRFVPQTLARRMQSTSSATLAPSTASLNSQPSGSSKPILSTDPSQRSSPKAKKPSPYRLLTPTQRDELLPPLQAQGWSVQPLPLSSQATQSPAVDKAQQQEELVGSFQFTHSKGKAAAQAAWRDTLRFVATAGEIIESEDHHPTITITPSGCSLGFIVLIQTHTHAPLPSVPGGEKPSPNLTRKDTTLASLISAAYERVDV